MKRWECEACGVGAAVEDDVPAPNCARCGNPMSRAFPGLLTTVSDWAYLASALAMTASLVAMGLCIHAASRFGHAAAIANVIVNADQAEGWAYLSAAAAVVFPLAGLALAKSFWPRRS